MGKTLEDIARELEVSTATVSRALSKSTESLVKKETRDKILQFIKKTGFKPNVKARALAKGKLTNFFLILSQNESSIFYDHYFINLVRGIHNVILDEEYSLVMLPVENDYSEDQIYKLLLNNETAGLILSPYCSQIEFPFDEIKEYSFPVISLDYKLKGENAYNILLDHKGAGYLGAKYLAEKNYKNIVLVSDIRRSQHSELRKEGFYKYFNEIKNNDFNIVNVEALLSFVSSEMVLEKVLEFDKLPTAVFALNDEIAVGLIDRLKEKGLRCPEDVAVLGFDGIKIGQLVNPSLNSVAFSFKSLGEVAAQTLIDVLSGKECERERVLVANVTEGQSC